MSRTRKKQAMYCHRSPRGAKQAQIHNLRKVPPTSWDDINFDSQCYMVDHIIEKIYNSGLELEEIERKIREDYRMRRWEWETTIRHVFDPTVQIYFKKLVCLNKDHTHTMPISCPDAMPYLIAEIDGLPIDRYLIIRENDLLRLQPGHESYKEKIYPFPNSKWTKILLYVHDHYINTGMIYQYTVAKWQFGFDKCTISAQEDPQTINGHY